jgi:hypothetical protein
MPVRFPLKRLTAAMLPMTFLWLWAACASICGHEGAAATPYLLTPSSASAGLAEASGASDCGGCPFASFPKATAPERATFRAGLEAPSAPPAPLAAAPVDRYTFVRHQRQPPPAPPPLDLLSTLRI